MHSVLSSFVLAHLSVIDQYNCLIFIAFQQVGLDV